jgi:hypothetical protein
VIEPFTIASVRTHGVTTLLVYRLSRRPVAGAARTFTLDPRVAFIPTVFALLPKADIRERDRPR